MMREVAASHNSIHQWESDKRLKTSKRQRHLCNNPYSIGGISREKRIKKKILDVSPHSRYYEATRSCAWKKICKPEAPKMHLKTIDRRQKKSKYVKGESCRKKTSKKPCRLKMTGQPQVAVALEERQNQ